MSKDELTFGNERSAADELREVYEERMKIELKGLLEDAKSFLDMERVASNERAGLGIPLVLSGLRNRRS